MVRPRQRGTSVLLVMLLLVALVAAACGDDDDAGDEDGAASSDGTATATVAGATSTTAAPATSTPPSATATAADVMATGTATANAATPSPALSPTQPAAGETLTLSVYFMRDEKVATAHREVPHTLEVAAAAMRALLAGPTDAEAAAGLTTAIPEGTEYLATAIEGTVATVNLTGEFETGGGSASMAARLAQVVYTLTQFPTIESVRFALDGEPVDVFGGEGIVLDEPVGRADFEELTPAIFVEAPAVGDTVASPLRVWGTANTFEAVFQLQVLDADGAVLIEEVVMATSGSGTRGTFDVGVPFDVPAGEEGTLRVFEASARDGSPVNVVEIPVVFGDA
jgi:spore germination protein GerM